MFRRLRERIERALERREAARPLSRDEVDRLLAGMREELIELRARIPRLERDAERLTARAQERIRQAESAHRRAQEAERAGEALEVERARAAARLALDEVEDLRSQAVEIRAEAERLRAEYAEKLERFREAERDRSALVARSRRVSTARKLDEMLRGPESGVRRFERAEEDIEAAEDLAAASREVEEALGERAPVKELEAEVELRKIEAAKEADEVERRLSELKRQIESED
jgi:phage shock protein A